MSTQSRPPLHDSALVQALSQQIDTLKSENERLRVTLSDCARNVGAVASPKCSLEFLECVSQEVRLVTERLRRERADALLDAERVREERNRVHVRLNAEWIRKTNPLLAFHEFFADRCEGLFMQFGMLAVDAYNEAARAVRTEKDPS